MEFRTHPSIHAIAQAQWDACFPGDPEGWAYYEAVERSGLPGFQVMVFEISRAGIPILVVPGFITQYRLDTTIQGVWKTLLRPLAPLLTLRLLCLGSAAADKCHLGLVAGLAPAERAAALDMLLSGLEAFAASQNVGLMAVKDLAEDDASAPVLAGFAARGYSRQPSLPNAVLPLPFADEEAYLASLSKATRKDIRRKLKNESALTVECLRGAQALGQVEAMLALYEGQRARSGVDFEQFEQLSPDYFRNVLTGLGDRALVFLYRAEGKLVGFNLCLVDQGRFIDKFIGLDDELARRVDLYVVSWMTNLRHCLAHGIPLLQTGQTAYAMKRRLGSRLPPNWLLFHHRNGVLNRILHLAGPLLAADRWDDS